MERQYSPELEIDIDPARQQREWAVQRIAVVALTALLVVIALGLFGRGGPLSETEENAEGGAMRVRYDRFLRNHSPDELEVTARARADELRLRLDSEYVRRIELQEVTPQPERVVAEPGALVFVFHVRPGAELHAAFHFSPDGPGLLKGWAQAGDAPRRPIAQFVYP